MQKVKGHGSKRRCWPGAREETTTADHRPWYARPAGRAGEVLIIGGGIASAMTALSLVEQGPQSDALVPGWRASDRRLRQSAGSPHPLLNGEHDALSRFYSLAFGFAEADCCPWQSATPSPSRCAASPSSAMTTSPPPSWPRWRKAPSRPS